MILQDKDMYPEWIPYWRLKYRGRLRIYLFWGITCSLAIILIALYAADAFSWETFGQDVTSTEVTRSFLAAWVVCFGLIAIMQDWNFPTFTSGGTVLIPGLKVSSITFGSPGQFYYISVSHKWLNYGIVIIIFLLDLNILRNQVEYVPLDFAQYTDSSNHIWTIIDPAVVAQSVANYTSINYAAREFNSTDIRLDAEYLGTSEFVCALALVPLFGVGVLFLILMKMENPKRVLRRIRRENTVKRSMATGKPQAERVRTRRELQKARRQQSVQGTASADAH